MKSVIAVLVLAALASASSIDTFRTWAKTHGKVYTATEEKYRMHVFEENTAIVNRLNMESHGARFAVNKFSDLTNEEFKAIYTTDLHVRQPGPIAVIADKHADESLDMRPWLPAIKDQAQCGSCWAFSAIANAEGAWYLRNHEVVSLSEQQVVSCDRQDSGCNGGLMTTADQYILKNGLVSEESYPYVSGTGSVPRCQAFTAQYQFSDAQNFRSIASDDTIIAYLHQYGPLSVAIEADSSVFQNYNSGILDSTRCGTSLNHGVTLVGFGTENGTPYWTVRNSWGSSWGESGYIRMARGRNMCGINGMLSTIVA
eukprot:m51a1_g7557 putative cysteine peptidase precursor (313) ;mRNA; r:111796-112734